MSTDECEGFHRFRVIANASRFSDPVVSGGEQCRWYFDPEVFGRLEVDNKLVLGRRLPRHVGGLLASEDAIDVTRRSPVVVQQVGSKREQAAVHREEARGIDGGQSMTCS